MGIGIVEAAGLALRQRRDGGRGAGETGVQRRKEGPAQGVPVEPVVRIGRVLDPSQVMRPRVRRNGVGPMFQQRAPRPPAVVDRPRPHAREPAIGTAQQGEQHRLHLIIAMVGQDQCVVRSTHRGEGHEPRPPRSVLLAPPRRTHFDPDHLRAHAHRGRCRHRGLRPAAGRRMQAVVDMHRPQ